MNPADADHPNPETTARQRRAMVAELLCKAPPIRDSRVLDAMAAVPRERFVPLAEQSRAYGDHPLPIGHGQTISQPYIVAWMTEALDLQPSDRVLEIGTGSGYQTAVLAHLAGEVFSIEVVGPLAERAAATLAELDIGNLHLRCGDGYFGWPEAAPFDAILVACSPTEVPEALITQLADDGRLAIPVGLPGDVQSLRILQKRSSHAAESDSPLVEKQCLAVRFVPMVHGQS